MIAKNIIIKGLVQGVGFRPAIYRIAHEYQLKGTVENNNRGVIINIEGNELNVNNFITDLPFKIPKAASINHLVTNEIGIVGYKDFSIKKSSSVSDEVTEVSPDIGVCDDCLHDIKSQKHRINYPFTNCTNCGPRFTIIRDLPYDRPKTTMDVFPMCEKCKKEYTDINDRRFHAQPVACNDCGPHYSLYIYNKEYNEIDEIISKFNSLITEGKIIAVKGLGGYHLACDAFNSEAVTNLRKAKNREGKPFAIMIKDVETAKKYLDISNEEKELLESWRRPVVLLKTKSGLAPEISIGLNSAGLMLPYMPLHYMIFETLNTDAIVLTSGNISDEPVIISNNTAINNLGGIADAVITYNREIHNRADDSVAVVINNKPRLIRRSRSYAPSPVEINLNTEGIFAAGAELVNCFAIGKGNQVILSQHIGDLKNMETLEFYKESVTRFSNLFRFTPTHAVEDMHPDYLSSRFADGLNIPITLVQHHHAHIASCMAEHNISHKVIGISFDGTGLGDDGNIWGGEFLMCDLIDYKRYSHFEYIKQPGGDAVSNHPWRMMTAYLHHYFGKDAVNQYEFLFKDVDKNELSTIITMLENNLNTPLTSSSGRLFDAVAALINVCKNASYHSEAPMQLESVASATSECYNVTISDTVCFKESFKEIIDDIEHNVPAGIISGKFHNTIIDVIITISEQIRSEFGINTVVLSGGTFQNRILLEKSERLLEAKGFRCLSQSAVPSNDGGIALGQLAIAAKRREMNLFN